MQLATVRVRVIARSDRVYSYVLARVATSPGLILSYPTCCPLVRFPHKDAARDGPICAHGNYSERETRRNDEKGAPSPAKVINLQDISYSLCWKNGNVYTNCARHVWLVPRAVLYLERRYHAHVARRSQ